MLWPLWLLVSRRVRLGDSAGAVHCATNFCCEGRSQSSRSNTIRQQEKLPKELKRRKGNRQPTSVGKHFLGFLTFLL